MVFDNGRPINLFPSWVVPPQFHLREQQLPSMMKMGAQTLPPKSSKRGHLPTSSQELVTEGLAYQTLYYNNTLDHLTPFSPTSRTTFSHRYLLNDEYFGAAVTGRSLFDPDEEMGGCRGPIFIYAGNEGDVTTFWESNGFMQYLAVTYGGLLLFPEERYYGETMPTTPDGTALLLSSSYYLTTQQVLEDYVELLRHVKIEYGAEACPTIAFGGSYGATLAAYLRLAYPFAVQGALAASSELGYYEVDGWEGRGITGYTFSHIVASQYFKTEGCLEAIWDAADLMDDMAATDDPTEIDVLLRTFHFCDVSALSPHGSSTFVYGLEGLPQQNYPYPVGSLPAWPVHLACEVMTDESRPLLERAAHVTAMSLGYDIDDGGNNNCLPTLDEGPGNVPGDGPGSGSWGFQSCTETLHEFSSAARDYDNLGLRNYRYSDEIANLTSRCMSLYNVVPDTHILARRYGGFDIAKTTTNTIFSTGALDPWGGAAISSRDGGDDAAERGVHFFEIPNGAHHLDLRGWNSADPEDVTEVRRQEEAIIVGWIEQYAHAKHGFQKSGGDVLGSASSERNSTKFRRRR